MDEGSRLLITVRENVSKEGLMEIKGISRVVIRRRSYATEIDLHTPDPEGTEKLFRSRFSVLDFIPIEEQPPILTQEFYNQVLSREDEIIEEARRLFSEERYWEAHTVLEDLWRASKGEKRKFIQGTILLAAAMVHYQKEEMEVAEKLYNRAIDLMKSTECWNFVSKRLFPEFIYPVEFPYYKH